MKQKKASLHIVSKKLNEVSINTRNPRLHPPDQIRKLQDSLSKYGFAKGSMVINTDGILLTGHGIYEAMKEEGYTEADFVEVDLPEGVAEAWMVADNKLGELSFWDEEELSDLLTELQDMPDIVLEDTGFELGELEDLFGDNSVTEDDFDVDGSLEEEPITQTGDLWLLGKHRVLCGDCTVKSDVERMMGGVKADMVFTDPPYGINVQGIGGSIGGEGPVGGKKNYRKTIGGGNIVKSNLYEPIVGDDKPFDPTPLLEMAAEQVIFGGNYFASKLPDSRGWFVWDKLDGMEGTTKNFSDFEMGWTSFEKPARLFRHRWHGLIKGSERNEKRCHPTQKPVALCAELIQYYGDGLQVILDPFLGSGTTLIACENLGRKLVGLEISCAYVDVIVKRYIAHKGTDDEVFVERDGKRLAYHEVSNTS